MNSGSVTKGGWAAVDNADYQFRDKDLVDSIMAQAS